MLGRNSETIHRDGRGVSSTRTAGTVAMLVLALVFVTLFFLRVFTPKPYVEQPAPVFSYNPDVMQEVMDWRSVQKEQEDILALGSRYLGQPGFYKTEEHIRQVFEEEGLEVYEQELWTVVPRTIRREFEVLGRDTSAADLPQIYPMMPNHLQPIATPDEGIEGELIPLTDEVLQERRDFTDCIGILDTSDGMVPKAYGYDWRLYAALGIKGVIVSHPGGLGEIPWKSVWASNQAMFSGVPINYPRLAATPEIFDYVGNRVRFVVQVRFQKTRNTTLIGILRAAGADRDNPSEEALLLTADYDACSFLPDHAPGTAQAIPAAVLLSLVKGLAPYRESIVRDVVFMAFGSRVMAHDGDANIIRLLDENTEKADRNRLLEAFRISPEDLASEQAERTRVRMENRLKQWSGRYEENGKRLEELNEILSLFENPTFLTGFEETEAALSSLNPDTREFLEEQLDYVLNTLIFELSEPRLQRRLEFLRLPEEDVESQEFQRYQAAKREYDRAVAAVGTGLKNLLDPEGTKRDFLADYDVRNRWRGRFEELREHHRTRDRQLGQDIEIIKLLSPYSQFVMMKGLFLPAYNDAERPEVLSVAGASKNENASMVSLLASAQQRLSGLEGQEEVSDLSIPPITEWHTRELQRFHAGLLDEGPPAMWTDFGYNGYVLLNFERSESYARFAMPVDLPYMRDLTTLKNTFRVYGEAVLMVVHGNWRFTPIQFGWRKKDFGGRVLASNVGQSIIPNYPLKNAILACRPIANWGRYTTPGYYKRYFLSTDPYGHYELVNNTQDFQSNNYFWVKGYNPVAAWYDETGQITWVKDEGEETQRLFKSVGLNYFAGDFRDVTIVAFRAAPVAVLDLVNPQTMKDYTGVRFVNSETLAEFKKKCFFDAEKGGGSLDRTPPPQVAYLEPDKHFYVAFEAGSLDNELAREVRGFAQGIPTEDAERAELKLEREIDGPGYLVQDTPILMQVPFEVATTMEDVNGKRLTVQSKWEMADERTRDYHGKAVILRQESEVNTQPLHSAILKARESVTYQTLNHPVLRDSVGNAVMAIIWYLALLVPFAFFFEKMVFGFTDIRKQLAAQGLIFLVVFLLLRILHPAFEMVRSSLMILLGFVIILISGGMSVLFSGKFQENLEKLRKRRGHVEAAQINKMGVAASAFMLGLNNMHRRKVRTGLTCSVLILMTFAMICFTSIESDLVDESVALGKAPYQGILVKRERFRSISSEELFAIRSSFSDRFEVCRRTMLVGFQRWEDKQTLNPELELVYEKDGRQRRHVLNSYLQLNYNDPIQHHLKYLTRPVWFTQEVEDTSEGPIPALIPDTASEQLGISLKDVEEGGVPVTINSKSFLIIGVFDSASLNAYRDLDGMDVLPFDLEAMPTVQQVEGQIEAMDEDPRIPAEKVMIIPYRQNLDRIVDFFDPRQVSVVLYMPDAPYREARAEIDSYLEQTGRPAFYGLDGVAYRGRRTRESTLEGMLEILIPLIIAALTVLNTVRGSVYERRDEIYVYNAIGIAPRYVFLMFCSEAIVYAVTGSVLGYLLSMGTGRVLTELGMTGGLRMTFTSMTAVYASWAITGAVLLSTYFPAKAAMEIAKPAEDAGWSLPEPEGDRLSFQLPFTFGHRGRIAVLAFCHRFFEDHGEGSSGAFFANPPEVGLCEEDDPLADGAPIPRLSCTVWLKPFDLGVSQLLEISLPTDSETGEYIARVKLTRISGTRESWLRLNRAFIARLRRQFLHWRAVDEEERGVLFEEAKSHLQETVAPAGSGQYSEAHAPA